MDIVRRADVLEFIERAAGANQTVVVGNQNLHSLYLCRSNAELVRFYERADLIEIDSMPMVYWGRLLGLKTQRQHRSTYLDWRDAFWRMAQRNGWRGVPTGPRRAWPKTRAGGCRCFGRA